MRPLKKSKVMSFRDGWNVPQGDLWDGFHQLWWGRSWQEFENPAQWLHVQKEICERLAIRLGTDGFLFQRAEYRAFNNRIRNAKAELSPDELFGCLILGQPGIGKSVFLIFFLLICMSKKENVLFTNSGGTTFLIDEEGVLMKPTAQFDIDDLSPATTRIWSLVDSPIKKVPPENSVTAQYPSKVFFIATLSPDRVRYNELAKLSVSIWWMSAWTDEELFTLLNSPSHSSELINFKKQFETLPAVQSLMETVGPCPRDIFLLFEDPVKLEDKVSRALRMLQSLQELVKHIRTLSGFSDDISHSIILVQRVGPVLETAFRSDRHYLKLKTHDIKQETVDKYASLELKEAERLFRICAGIGPQGAAFAGNLFEGLAIRYTSGEDPGQGTFRLFAEMKKVDTSSKKFPIRYIYNGPGHKWTVNVDGDRHVVLKGTPLQHLEYPLSARGDNKIKTLFSSRTRVEYSDKGSITINPSFYYCPSARNNPLFDAFFFEVSSDAVILWVLQITIQRDHDGVSKGFEMIKTLMTQARQSRPDLEVKVGYVLVMAYKAPGLDVEWNFASEFNQCPGDVFIQQIDLDVLRRGGDNFNLEDIYGMIVE